MDQSNEYKEGWNKGYIRGGESVLASVIVKMEIDQKDKISIDDLKNLLVEFQSTIEESGVLYNVNQ